MRNKKPISAQKATKGTDRKPQNTPAHNDNYARVAAVIEDVLKEVFEARARLNKQKPKKQQPWKH